MVLNSMSKIQKYNPVSYRAALEILKARPDRPLFSVSVHLKRLRGKACRHVASIGFKSTPIFVCGLPKGHRCDHEDVYGSMYLERRKT
jgi:hypothetical protein